MQNLPKCDWCGREYQPGTRKCKGCSQELPRFVGILRGKYIREDEETEAVLCNPSYMKIVDPFFVGIK